MPSAPLPVLLLGWNDAPRTGESVPALGLLVETLATTAPVRVMVPHLPAATLAPAAQVTSLADLTPDQALAPSQPANQHPAAWQHPAAPYSGTATDGAAGPAAGPDTSPGNRPSGASGGWNTPASPYLGATPGLAAATLPMLPALEERPAVIDQRATRAAVLHSIATLTEATEEGQADELLRNQSELAPAEAEPGPGTAAAPTRPTAPVQPEAAGIRTAVHATLPEALAVLGVDLAPDADLNFQVIQYARFATRQALQDTFAVIYAPDWPTWLAALEIRQQTGRPLVLHVHSLAQERATPADRGWALELERLALRRADLILAASDELAHRLRTRYQVAPDRLQLVEPTDAETLRRLLQQLETRLPGHQSAVPFFPPTA
ncbi:glycosyltransferase [Hymenobacter metallilatus]|uniref:Glycosyltransferase subfamily 4-like N-terminal domain-containing protein n=1 Tax=Hymenobacter metallilatus TaxID=2493666 RepID=A0A428JRN6_9BACT|nr:glycosyltransferase [Hymenobacter metallilatus]RSK36224.1 hypothetical protein EI290_04890 [Hymenobacter metallilatus]